MKKNSFFSLLFLVLTTTTGFAQTVLTESFDTDLNWTVAHPTGTSTNAGWTRVTTGTSPTTAPFLGGGMARFNSYSISSGNSYSLTSPAMALTGEAYRVVFRMYRDNDYESSLDRIEVFLNTTAAAGGTSLGVFNRNRTLAPVAPATGWHTYTIDIPGTPTGDHYLSFLATSGYGNNMYIDEVVVERQPSDAPVCVTEPNVAVNNCGNFENIISWASVPGASGYGLSIGTTAGGTDIEDNIDLGNQLSYSLTGTAATEYFYTIIPYNAIGAAEGCEEFSFTTATQMCYCPSIPTSNDGDGISGISFGAQSFSVQDVTYTDFTSNVVNLASGEIANIAITFETYYSYAGHIWIDFNGDYDFDDEGELVKSFESELYEDLSLVDASFLIPASIATGQYRMRIGTADSGQETPNTCYSGSYGVTLDFVINIVEANCSGAVATAVVVANCDENTYSISINVTDLGDGTPVLSDGTTLLPIVSTGTIIAGPYATGTPVTLVITHGTEAICNTPLGNFAYVCPAENDQCADAITLTVTGTYQEGVIGNTSTATGEDPDDYQGDCYGYEGGDIWYTAIVPASGNLTIETGFADSDSEDYFDTVMTVYSGSCGQLEFIDCNDDFGDYNFSTITLTGRQAGETIYIQVYEYNNDDTENSFNISAYDASLSNEQFTASSLKVYPNPVTSTLNLSNIANINTIEVYNLLGQKVTTAQTNSTNAQVDMSALTQGTYIVRITTADSVETVKVIKQ